MSHELEIKANGEAVMAYAGEVPWHGLGKKVSSNLTPKQMLKEAGLNYTVDLCDVYTKVKVGKNEKEIVLDDRKALVRSSDKKVIASVGNDWVPVQNEEAFDFFREWVKAGDMEMHTAGSLHEGQIIWALAKIKKGGITLFGKDRVEGHLLFSNYFKYGFATDIRATAIRVVCNNTHSLALKKGDTEKSKILRVSHRNAFDAEQAKAVVNSTTEQLRAFKEVAEFLGSKRYTNDLLKAYLMEVFPLTNTGEVQRKTINKQAQRGIDIIGQQPGANMAEGTWWQAFNVTTFITDHEMGRSDSNRLESAWYGQNSKRKDFALAKAVEYANAA